MKCRYFILVLIVLFVAASLNALAATDESQRENIPNSHKSDWLNKHQSYSKSDSRSCKSCHNSYFCINCHENRDSIQELVHRRNFKFYHSITARNNPRKCDVCHKPSYCNDCHTNPR